MTEDRLTKKHVKYYKNSFFEDTHLKMSSLMTSFMKKCKKTIPESFNLNEDINGFNDDIMRLKLSQQ